MKDYRVRLLKDGSIYFSVNYGKRDNTTNVMSVKLESLGCTVEEGSDNITEKATQEIKNLIGILEESVDA